MFVKTFVSLAAMLIGAQALAFISPSALIPSTEMRLQAQPPVDASEAPQPATPFNFKVAKQLWDSSTQPSESDLIGRWNSIGWADVSMDFAGLKNYYVTTGYKNADGSNTGAEFGDSTDVLGQNQFYVTYFNLGVKGANQGPYTATISAAQKAVVSSRYAYQADGSFLKSYFERACRLSPRDADLLICGVTLRIDVSEKSRMAPANAAYDNVMGGMELFKRVR